MVRLAPEGVPFILTLLLLSLATFLAGFPALAALFVALALFCAFFFRDPQRQGAFPPEMVLAPADGKVLPMEDLPPWVAEKGFSQALAIFMSPADVHVNRAPVGGVVREAFWRPGKKFPAFRPKASELNEHSFVLLESPWGPVAYRQIAGALARRVVCDLHPGMEVERGQRVGIIKFSSRVELYLPGHAELLVRPGDKVRAGLTPVARFGAGP